MDAERGNHVPAAAVILRIVIGRWHALVPCR
jgi:hypothetical protein